MFSEYMRLSLDTLAANRLRSFLTVVAIAIGVCAVILLTSLARSGLATMTRGLEELGGARFILMWPDSPHKQFAKAANDTRGLNLGDIDALERGVPLIASITGFKQKNDATVRRLGNADGHTALIWGDPRFVGTFAYKLAEGRGLTPEDLATRAHVAVLGDDVAKHLFPGESPVGQEVILQGDRYRVVGRFAHASKGGMSFGFEWNDMALAPLTIAQPDRAVDTVALQSRDKDRNTDLLDVANAILLARHNQVDDFRFLDFGGMLKNMYMVFYGMIVVVGLIAGMSLVIGGVGIMNIMLVAVVERKREIGIRRAIGATKAAIMTQFLIEATVLSLVGASFGLLAGGGLSELVATVVPSFYPDWVGLVDGPAAAVAVLAAAGTGVFFGWYPARQAAGLDPILCLRAD